MTPITLADYFAGRDLQYADELTEQIRVCAAVTVERANALLRAYADATGDTAPRFVNSGWRPRAVNARVRGSAPRSRHVTGEAIDIDDRPGTLDSWCITTAGLAALELAGLWLEHPDSSPTWTHWQVVPPRSGRRVFKP